MLGECIDCGYEVSDSATTCPRCGQQEPYRNPYGARSYDNGNLF